MDAALMQSRNPQSRTPRWAVLGAGNGGQSLAGHLAILGFSVRLYDIVPATIEAIAKNKGVEVDGAVNGFGAIDFATTRIEEILDGADVVMVVAPAIAHRAIAKQCSPHLADGQIVFLHPGATCGALEFRKALDDERCKAAVRIAEASSLLYTCRSSSPGHASILGIKKVLPVAALPARDTAGVLATLQTAFPQMQPAPNVFQTSFENPNIMVHPAPTVLSTALVESDRDWLYYPDGITPSVGAFVEKMDLERLAVGRALGLQLPTILEWYRKTYDTDGATLSEAVRRNKAYDKVKGQHTLHTRYILEDVPMALTPVISLGKLLGLPTPMMQTIAALAEFLVGKDLTTTGRTVERLGLAGMNAQAILRFVEHGER